MNKRPFLILPFVACFSLSGAGSVLAQEPPAPEPPTFLRITREVAKPGTLSDLAYIGAARSIALRNANWPRVSLGLTSVTGPEEVLFLTFYDSLGALEKDREEINKNPALKNELDRLARQEGDLLLSKRDVTVSYKKEISYRPNFDWAQTRCMDLITVHLNAARHAEYLENRKMTLEAHERGGLDTHLFIYAVSSGMPSWTYLIVRPMKSLSHLDMLREQGFGEPMSAEQKKRQTELFGAAAQSEEEEYFCVDPRMSYATTSWAGSNLNFWIAPSK